jgi:MarR family transcriptional regulator for hemolysin
VRLTEQGDALFFRLREAAMAFDERLRVGLSEHEVDQLETLLARLGGNVS